LGAQLLLAPPLSSLPSSSLFLLPPLHLCMEFVGALGGASMEFMGVGGSSPPAPMVDSPLAAGNHGPGYGVASRRSR
jgi:hypothetical protein